MGLQGAKKLVQKLHALGFKVVPWTVNGPKNWQSMMDAGVDGIITDDPEGLITYYGKP
jgi:glycerophosphoryl diester phosphodiesterase